MTVIDGLAVPDTAEDAEKWRLVQSEIDANPEKYANHRWCGVKGEVAVVRLCRQE